MKLIIDIPEEDYNFVKKQVADGITNPLKMRIANGTPLPKGHGRLIDADELTKQLETVANDEWNKQVGASKGLEDAIDIVDNEQTIIEADKAERSDQK